MKNTIKNNHVAPHPELTSTLSCEAALCSSQAGSQALIQALQAARPRQGPLKSSGRAGTSPTKSLVFPVFCFFSACGSEMQHLPKTTRQYSCCSATLCLLRRLFCSSETDLKRKMRWRDPRNLPKQQGPYEQMQVSSSDDPGSNIGWGAAVLHLLLLCIWSVLKHLLAITQI